MEETIMKEETKQKRFSSYDTIPMFLSGGDVANLLGLSRTTVYYLFRDKDFPTITIGKRIMVRREKLFSWIEDHEKSVAEPTRSFCTKPKQCKGEDEHEKGGAVYAISYK